MSNGLCFMKGQHPELNKDLIIDGNAPSVLSVTSSKVNGGYKAGDTIPISVNFNQIVILTGSNQIMMETGSTDQAASYASGSGTATLVYNYIVSYTVVMLGPGHR